MDFFGKYFQWTGRGEGSISWLYSKLGGFKHKIFKWRQRIVKQQPMFYYFQDKHKLLDGKLEFKDQNYNFNSYEMELYSVVSKATPKKIVFGPN